MRLLPRDRQHGWVPYVWLVYLVFFFFHPILDHVSWKEWLASVLGVLVFLQLYFSIYRLQYPRRLWPLGGILLLGVVFAPTNAGAAAFFIYAASLVPFAVETELAAAKGLAVVLLAIGLESWLLHLPAGFWLPAAFFSLFIGAGNIYFAQRSRAMCRLQLAQDEIAHLAKVAERERIARDLHDVLGHTLSLIILKSELAGKLLDRDLAEARKEIAEVEKISRDALTDVRQAIGGYRATGLQDEFVRAQTTLRTAGVDVASDLDPASLSPAQETVLALIVREAVTNIVRHAAARNCRLRLSQKNGDCLLEIQDDGRGGFHEEGNGLRGMRERVEALGGTLQRDTSSGTRLTIALPLSSKESTV